MHIYDGYLVQTSEIGMPSIQVSRQFTFDKVIIGAR